MPVIAKELLEPGTFYPVGGPVNFTANDLADYCRSSNRMILSGRRIPVPLEHRDDALPLSHADALSELTVGNTGWVKRFYLKGQSLWADLEIRDAAVAQKLRDGLIPFVSPELRDLFSADGTVYRNVVTHVALTNKPVWKDQKPFHVPEGWIGGDGAIVAMPARQRLSLTEHLRLSLADAVPEEVVQEAIRSAYPYRVPGGSVVVFRGVPYEKYVPRKILDSAETEGPQGRAEVADLLRKMAARMGRRIARDLASYHDPKGDDAKHPAEFAVAAKHLNPKTLAPLDTPHPEEEPALAWEDPRDGHLHVASGHEKVATVDPDERVPVRLVRGQSPEEAAGVVFLWHLLNGRASPQDLAQFYRDTELSPVSLHEEMKVLGKPISAELSDRAYRWSRLPDEEWEHSLIHGFSEDEVNGDPEETAEGAGVDGAEEATIPAERPRDDPPDDLAGESDLDGSAGGADGEELSFTDWLMANMPPAHRRHLQFSLGKTTRLSGGAMPDTMNFTKETPPPATGAETPPPEMPDKKPDAPSAGGKTVDYFKESLGLLEKFGVPLSPDTTEQNFLEHLYRALHVLDAADAGPEGSKEPPLVEEKPINSGVTPMSLEDKVKSLEAAVVRLSNERDTANKRASTTEYAAICREIDGMQADGQMTKADADEAKATLGVEVNRLSMVGVRPTADALAMMSKLVVYRKIPKGTFPTANPTIKPVTDSKVDLSLETTTNDTSWEDRVSQGEVTPERLAAVIKEFHGTVSIPGLNGVHR